MPRSLICFVSLLSWATAQAAIPPPPALAGAAYGRLSEYFQSLAKSSGRVRIIEAGRTGYDRPMFVAAIGTADNLRRLQLSKQSRGDLLFAWAGFGPAEAQRAAEFGYRLATAENLPRNVVVLLAPSLNPDGNDLLAEWHRQNAGSDFAGAPLPRLIQRYGGSDAPADAYMMNLAETRNFAALQYGDYPVDFVYSEGEPVDWVTNLPTHITRTRPQLYRVSREQSDIPTAYELLQRFVWNGAKVSRRKSDGSFVVEGGDRVSTMVEKLRIPDLMGVRWEQVEAAGDTEPAGDLRPEGTSGGSGEAVLLDPRENNSYLGMAFLFDRMELVWWTADGQLRIDSGFTNSPVRALNFSHEVGIRTRLADPDTAKPHWQLYRPRTAVYEPWMDNPDTGWTEWVLDLHKLPYTVIHNEDFQKDDLSERFDVIILASQKPSIMHGDTSAKQRPEYTGGIGLDGASHLQHFVKNGGTLITFGLACSLPVEQFGLPLKTTRAPGAIAAMSADTSNPVAFGMPKEFTAANPDEFAWDVPASVISIARFQSGATGVAEVKIGKGKAVLFSIHPQYRGETFATFKLLLNAITTGRAREIR